MRTSGSDWRTRRILIALIIATGLILSAVGPARVEAAPADPPRLSPETLSERAGKAWIVNTRGAASSCPSAVSPEQFSYRVSRGDCDGWRAADADAFFASAAGGGPVIVFIHGNRTDACEAIREGRSVYRRLQCESGGEPFCFVIWSWPADRVCGGPRKDALVKAARSDTQSFYLASWLGALSGDTPVTLIGYSFGARVICGALHLREGGSLSGRALEVERAERKERPARVMLLAAALDCEWLLPGSRNGLALGGIEQMMITRNCCDPVLRFYPRMRRYDSSSALGFAGPARPSRLTEAGAPLETVAVESQVGRDHSWYAYARSRAFRSRLGWYAFLAEEETADGK